MDDNSSIEKIWCDDYFKTGLWPEETLVEITTFSDKQRIFIYPFNPSVLYDQFGSIIPPEIEFSWDDWFVEQFELVDRWKKLVDSL